MPNYDGTGPNGMGSQTGRGMGFCRLNGFGILRIVLAATVLIGAFLKLKNAIKKV